MAEVRYLTSKSYDWIVEGDIKACFDEISHTALMDRVSLRIEDKRVLALVKAFLKAGILREDRLLRETTAGTPQGSILSPLLSNVALSVLDEYVAQAPGGPSTGKVERARQRRHGLPNYRLSRGPVLAFRGATLLAAVWQARIPSNNRNQAAWSRPLFPGCPSPTMTSPTAGHASSAPATRAASTTPTPSTSTHAPRRMRVRPDPGQLGCRKAARLQPSAILRRAGRDS
ncbi:reverse transcriptase/maturase family protein [Streptomyces sp. NPDC006703]|uniref:reverse transcriptase/maturase family protein n=1 Tax=Streptomyces sp. NPDC006703 TaxID=3364759 RepID=UPI0036C917D5